LETSLSLEPEDFEAWINLGVVYREVGRPAEAIDCFDRAVRLRTSEAVALSNVGSALQDLGRFKDAAYKFGQAICLKPDYAEALSNRAVSAFEEADQIASLLDHERALLCKPNYLEGKVNFAMGLLQNGDYSRGWALYEARTERATSSFPTNATSGSRLSTSEGLTFKRVLFHAEQGFGDTLQFCRYGALARVRGAEVILLVPKPLSRLMRGQSWVSRVVDMGDSLPVHDLSCALMSLPLAFGTTLETIPYGGEAYLHALPEDVERWGERLGERNRPRVGLVWNGGFRADQPELWAVNERRNVPLELFAQALDIAGIDFVSLQKGDPAESEIRGREGEYWKRGRLYNYAAELTDFADTAGLIANLDLVISVDTSTAHLSAAMGKPTWLLNRYDTCWRWLLDREDSPWYGSVKLYRQGADRDWRPVLQRVAQSLREFVSSPEIRH